ncbi:transglutaminase family protein [Actinocorallia sp. A-T 12471]|uniref:transglutaminase-like domain-containing protein n=1 Tax=Actinocorallia sp. A-T 12471 TaxID=3089813 RepID=UPI0029D1643D|nr:transglutaminase family protein [Actinocorallia sp. A-T 12471]MDX6743418.1 transglutaminase family protein [Actinocorallia sp. A-T 12471]
MEFVGEPWDFLGASEAVDFEHPAIQELSSRFPDGDLAYAHAAFDHVRDEITHSGDADDPRVPWRASDVLEQGTGLCYAKDHLYVALLRLAGIPSGFGYQRLSDDEGGFVLHGFVVVQLEDRWIRLDPRGDRPGLRTWFSAEEDILAYRPDPSAGETTYAQVFAQPHPSVLSALRDAEDRATLCAGRLPSSLD